MPVGVAFDIGSGRESFICVDGDDADLRREVRQLADGPSVDVGLVDRSGVSSGILLGEEDAVRLAAGDEGVRIAAGPGSANRAGVGGGFVSRGRIRDEQARLVRLHIEHMDAVRRGVDHRLVVGRVGVDVEVEAAGVRLIAQPPDAVAGIFVDPTLWRQLRLGEG